MKRLALALAVGAAFAAGCDDKGKDQGAVSPQAPADQKAAVAQKSPDAAKLMSFAENTDNAGGGGSLTQGNPGGAMFDGAKPLAYTDPGGGVFAGPSRSFGPRPPIKYTSPGSTFPSDLALPGPPSPTGGGAEKYAGLRSTLIRGGAEASVVDQMIAQSIQKGMDPLMTLAIGTQESSLRNNVTSRVHGQPGARGAMQLMPATACGLGVCNTAALYNPTVNVGLGTTYFQKMLTLFGRPDLAIAAYNAGPGAIQKYGGVPPYAETQNYVRRVSAYYQQYRRLVSQTVSV
jgi:hypothetical protein